MKINTFTPEELAAKFSESVAAEVSDFLKISRVNLFLSGGSVTRTYDQIGNLLSNTNNLNNLTISQIDERYDENPLHENSNQKIILQSKIYGDLSRSVDFKFILNGTNAEEEQKNFEQFLDQKLIESYVNVAIIGMGSDGHILGVKPEKSLESFKRKFLSVDFVALYDAEDFRNRITITLTALKKMDKSFLFVCGEEKREVLKKLVDKKTFELNEFPAQFLKELPNVEVFTDIVL
jgi:6-phosphogluconolactonase/glucosamine-6-phosphate isomerase/deaminase